MNSIKSIKLTAATPGGGGGTPDWWFGIPYSANSKSATVRVTFWGIELENMTRSNCFSQLI